VVLLPDVGKVEVANLVLSVEGDEQSAVSDGDVTWHRGKWSVVSGQWSVLIAEGSVFGEARAVATDTDH
jgi:hypothetical protein